jgi:hypothetical protein
MRHPEACEERSGTEEEEGERERGDLLEGTDHLEDTHSNSCPDVKDMIARRMASHEAMEGM